MKINEVLIESKMAELDDDLENLSDEEFEQKYNMAKEKAEKIFSGSHRWTANGDSMHEHVNCGTPDCCRKC